MKKGYKCGGMHKNYKEGGMHMMPDGTMMPGKKHKSKAKGRKADAMAGAVPKGKAVKNRRQKMDKQLDMLKQEMGGYKKGGKVRGCGKATQGIRPAKMY